MVAALTDPLTNLSAHELVLAAGGPLGGGARPRRVGGGGAAFGQPGRRGVLAGGELARPARTGGGHRDALRRRAGGLRPDGSRRHLNPPDRSRAGPGGPPSSPGGLGGVALDDV